MPLCCDAIVNGSEWLFCFDLITCLYLVYTECPLLSLHSIVQLQGGKAGKGGKGSYSKATKGKAGKSSSSYSYSMSFGPPSPCCDPSYIEGIVNAAASSNGWTVQDDALQWLIDDSCKCGRTVCWDDARYIQRYILATFYYSTIGDKWETCSQPSNIRSQKQCRLGDRSQYANQNGFRWLTCNNECGWGGLSCKIGDDDTITDDITRMDMAENNVGGQLPEEVAALNELQILSFEENKIGGPIPTEYSGLTNLLLFDFDKNKLDGPLPDFSGMQNIQQIDLTKNELEGTIVGKGLDLLTSLAFLDLSENKFEGFIPAFNSNSLLRLFLNNNSFKGRIDVTSSVLGKF